MKLPAFLTPSDAALVRGALRDDPRAFERLVFRYQRRAHAVARAAGVPESAADDAVQEAFLKAFRHLPALKGARELRRVASRAASRTSTDRRASTRGSRSRPSRKRAAGPTGPASRTTARSARRAYFPASTRWSSGRASSNTRWRADSSSSPRTSRRSELRSARWRSWRGRPRRSRPGCRRASTRGRGRGTGRLQSCAPRTQEAQEP